MSATRYVTVNGKWRLTQKELEGLIVLVRHGVADMEGVSDDDLCQHFGSKALYRSGINAVVKLLDWKRYTDELETVAVFNRKHGTRHTTQSARRLMRGSLRPYVHNRGEGS